MKSNNALRRALDLPAMSDHEGRIRAALDALGDAIVAALAEAEDDAVQKPPRLLSIVEAAALCGITRSTFYTKVLGTGAIKPIRIGGRVLVAESAVRDFMEGAAVASTAARPAPESHVRTQGPDVRVRPRGGRSKGPW